MKLWALATVLCLTAILAGLLTAKLFIKEKGIIGVQAVPIDLTVAEFVGINTDNDALHFGTIPPGNSGRRWVSLANDNIFPVTVSVRFEGTAASFVHVLSPDPELRLEGKESRNLTITASVPVDATSGNYTGMAYFSMKQAN